jgi:hypothetical protein
MVVCCASHERRHHRWPVYGSPMCRLAPQHPGCDQLDARCISTVSPALQDSIPSASRRVAPRREAAHRPLVHDLQKLSAPDPRKIACSSFWSISRPMLQAVGAALLLRSCRVVRTAAVQNSVGFSYTPPEGKESWVPFEVHDRKLYVPRDHHISNMA